MKILFTIVALCATCCGIFAQTEPLPPGMKYIVSYTVEEESYYTRPQSTPIESLSPLDKQKMVKNKVVKSVERQVEENGDHTTIVQYLNPDEAFKEWPTPIGSILIDKTGKTVFKKDGSFMVDTPADSAYTAEYEQMKTFMVENDLQLMTELPIPDAANLQTLSNSGYTVTNGQNGSISISDGHLETRFDPAHNTISRLYYEGQRPVKTETTIYRITEGVLTPAVERIEIDEVRPSGACMKSVVVKRYTSYAIQRNEGDRSVVHGFRPQQGTLIQPNPAAEQAAVLIGMDVIPGSTIQLLNISGTVLQEHGPCYPGSKQHLSLSGLRPGVYFVKLTTREGFKTLKLVKQS